MAREMSSIKLFKIYNKFKIFLPATFIEMYTEHKGKILQIYFRSYSFAISLTVKKCAYGGDIHTVITFENDHIYGQLIL